MNSSIWSAIQPMRVWERVDAGLFRTTIEPLHQPAVLRGLVAHWPAVARARQSPQALADYLQAAGNAQPIATFIAEPKAGGRFFYSDDLQGLNFEQKALPLQAILKYLLREYHNEQAPGLYAGGLPVQQYLPGLLGEHTLDLIDAAVPRKASLWIGNRSRVAAHWDQPQNVACVISGRRRYTLFPTGQVKNLYFGPLDRTPAGPPISLVDFHRPDFERHPKFRQALEHALVADLEPGDAVYIPSLWVHHAESHDPFGLMMNFWWHEAPAYLQSPFTTMLHALLTVRDLPPAEREGWRALFDLYIFGTEGDPMAHIPPEARGLFGQMTPARARQIAAHLQRSLERLKATDAPAPAGQSLDSSHQHGVRR
jgi:hypothetical protein